MINVEKGRKTMVNMMKKVACLYRVSSAKQVGTENDLPLQENAVREFIAKHEDWEWCPEFEYFERGVSGYSVPLAQRDELNRLIRDAKDKKFQVLVVFMYDRLGRQSYAIPALVSELTKDGIEIWSVKDGEIKCDSHDEEIMNFIRGWQAEGESRKTSMRVTEKHAQMAKAGEIVSNVPYGYKFELTGEVNKKGKAVRRVVIVPEEAEIVKEVFRLCYEQGMGSLRIANELNQRGIPTRKNSSWQSVTIANMLQNTFYIGFPAIHKTFYERKKGKRPPSAWLLPDECREDLVIISKEVFDKVQKIRTSRTPNCYKKENLDYSQYPLQTKSSLLFTGFCYCGHCGSKLSTGSSWDSYTTKDGVKHRVLRGNYKCITKTSTGKDFCSGRGYYSQKKVESAVMEQIFLYFDGLAQMDCKAEIMEEMESEYRRELQELKKMEGQLEQCEKTLRALGEQEIKALIGESSMPMERIQLLIKKQEDAKAELAEQLERKRQEIEETRATQEQALTMIQTIPVWREEFEKCKLEQKKMMLAEIIERVDVYKGEVRIRLKMNIEEFLRRMAHPIENTSKSIWDVSMSH